MNILSWMYIDHVNNNIESLQKQIGAIESESLRKQKQVVYDQIKKEPPGHSKAIYKGTAYSKGEANSSLTLKVAFVILLVALSYVIYQFIDVIASLVVFVVLFSIMIFTVMKPQRYTFRIYEMGIELYGRYYPWNIFSSYAFVHDAGNIYQIIFTLKEDIGKIPFWFSKEDASKLKEYVDKNI